MNREPCGMKDGSENLIFPIKKSEKEWRDSLSPEQFRLLREGGTERGGTGKFLGHFENGAYHCAGCHQVLFSSQEKFESGSGWPSWWRPAAEDRVTYIEDNKWGMRRVEVVCSGCGGHLGHVFEDGPTATSQRY